MSKLRKLVTVNDKHESILKKRLLNKNKGELNPWGIGPGVILQENILPMCKGVLSPAVKASFVTMPLISTLGLRYYSGGSFS